MCIRDRYKSLSDQRRSSMRRRLTTRLFLSCVFAAICVSSPAFGQFSGKISVTESSGNPVVDNVFSTREQVFFTAGPTDSDCSIGALADGIYAFQVTDATGTTLLSTDDVSNRMFLAVSYTHLRAHETRHDLV